MKNLIEQIKELNYLEELNVEFAGKMMTITRFSPQPQHDWYSITCTTETKIQTMNIDYMKGTFVHFYKFDMFGNKSQCKINIKQFRIV